jgi:hypothetical protein
MIRVGVFLASSERNFSRALAVGRPAHQHHSLTIMVRAHVT